MRVTLKSPKRALLIGALLLAAVIGVFAWRTRSELLPLPASLTLDASRARKVQILDRHSIALTITYQNRWNLHDVLPLQQIPLFLQKAFVFSEDRRFFSHNGVDWKARVHALFQNIRARRAVRGASTISEQVVRMWHPRPRTLWSRWLEGLEAGVLERRFSKADILEFYLNQVPYAGCRRGVLQAARYYFGRDLDTLSRTEILALVVMVRAPARLDVHKEADLLRPSIHRLAKRLAEHAIIHGEACEDIRGAELRGEESEGMVRAEHFVHYLYRSEAPSALRSTGRLRTTLDASLQRKVQAILDYRLKDLRPANVRHAAAVVMDHKSDEVLAWVNGGVLLPEVAESWIDAVTTPRQPGSTLKPFLYGLALEKGWTAATMLDDSPLAEPVGLGLHAYRNYSRTHYGRVRLRDALGNSLNIPAVRAIRFVGVEDFLNRLHELGIRSLSQHPDYYGDGLALGNGEVTLLELVKAYAVLARQGVDRSLKFLMDDHLEGVKGRRVFSPEVASLVGNILSDPDARGLEFGRGSLLHFPVQTAVKTGTSSDYRDAWAVGYNYRYTVGVWMGNFDQSAMEGVTGSTGPALVLRAVFAELNRHRDTRPLFLSPRLIQVEICRESGLAADGPCPSVSEWFVPGTVPAREARKKEPPATIYLRYPTEGLQLAMDPRIPDDEEAFSFEVAGLSGKVFVDWIVDGLHVASTSTPCYLWSLRPGMHTAQARVWISDSTPPVLTGAARFQVK